MATATQQVGKIVQIIAHIEDIFEPDRELLSALQTLARNPASWLAHNDLGPLEWLNRCRAIVIAAWWRR